MASPGSIRRNQSKKQNGIPWIHWAFAQQIDKVSNESKREPYGIGSMYDIYRNIYVYHQYTPNFSIYTIHGSYGYGMDYLKIGAPKSVDWSSASWNVFGNLPDFSRTQIRVIHDVMVIITAPFFMRTPSVKHVGLSENSVPLHPMVNDHYPY